MATMRKLRRSVETVGERPLWAVHVGRGEIVWQDRCDATNGSKEQNSLDRSKGPDQQNNVPPKCHTRNNVCQFAYGRNSVPSFRDDFRMAEFFNTISPKRPFNEQKLLRD